MNIVQIPLTNEIRFAPEGVTLPARYHQKHPSRGWMYELLLPFQKKKDYKIRKQLNDRNCIQVHSNAALADINLIIYDKDLTVIDTIAPTSNLTVSGNTDSGVQLITYQWDFITSDAISAEGTYTYVIEAEANGITKYFYSEPIKVLTDWKGTVLIEYTHDKNDYNTIFSLNTRFSIRVNGYLIEDEITEDDTQFVDQFDVAKTLSSDTTYVLRLELEMLPFYLLRTLKEAFRCKTIVIEQFRIDKANGAQWEATKYDASSLVHASIKFNYYTPKDTFTFRTGPVLNLFSVPSSPIGVTSLMIWDANFGIVTLMTNIVIEDAADTITKVAAMNQITSGLGMTGAVVIDTGMVVYENAPDENFIIYFSDIHLKVTNLNLDLPTAAGAVSIYYRCNPDKLVDWGDGTVEVLPAPAFNNPNNLAKTHTYANGAATTETARIFHNDDVTVLNVGDPTDTAHLLSITGVISSTLLKHGLQKLSPTLTNWDLSYLNDAFLTLERLTLTGTTIETLNTDPFNVTMIKLLRFHNLKFISFVNNKLTQAAIETFVQRFVSNCNISYNGVSYGAILMNGQNPAVTYSAQTVADYLTLTNAGWYTQ